MPGFYTLLARTKVDWDIVTLTECWLPSTHSIPNLEGYNYFKTVKNLTQNEGIVVYIQEHLKVSVEEPSIIEANCLQIKIDRNTVLLAIYRPPGYKDVNIFLNSLDTTLLNLASYRNIIITGDININIHDQCHDSVKNNYLNLLASHGLLPAHVLPTRQLACLDHFMLKTAFPAMTLVAHSALTDHETVLLFLAKKTPRLMARKIVDRINHVQLDEDLKLVDFSPVYLANDPHVAADLFVSLIMRVIDSNTKSVKVPNRKKIIKPWITRGLLRCIQHRDNLHKKIKEDPDNLILNKSYTRYRNYCNKLLKKAKLDHDRKEINDAGNNTKHLWSAINSITNRVKKKEGTSELLSISTTPKQSVNEVNNFFADVGKSLAEKIVTGAASTPRITSCDNSQSMVFLPTDEVEVTKLIMCLRDDCAIGWDRISNSFLKKHIAIIAPSLTHICNLALDTGKFPRAFKKSIVHPVFKGGDRSRVNNYRPIAVLPALSKILERIMCSRLVDYLESHNLLSSSQYGFRAGKSTCDAVHDLTNFIVTNMDAGRKVLGIFLDLAKAFDTVSVPLLIRKMECLGIRGVQLDLFEDYLSGRTQSVKMGEYVSDERQVTYGVPQGSVLGPILFLIYINDLGMLSLPGGKIISFADDTALLFSAATWNEVYGFAQSGFNMVSEWLRNNILTLNAEKTNYVTFAIKHNRLRSASTPLSIVAHTCPMPYCTTCTCVRINKADNVKYLGIILDSTLKFREHISVMSGRLRKLIYVFKTLRPVAEDKVKRSVYFALAQSLLTYCITSWGGAPKYTILELERAQRAILKVSLGLPFRYPTTLLYREAKVLTVRQLFIQRIIMKQHSLLTYSPSLSRGKRRYNPVDSSRNRLTTRFSQRFFSHLGHYLYNKINRILPIYDLNKIKCKMKLTGWIQELNYEETEKILAVSV